MGYTIEKAKRVISVNVKDKRFDGIGETCLYVSACACNNVTPRTFDWDVHAWTHFSVWNGEIILPNIIWNYAYDADGGGIKSHGRDVAGVDYIKSWKRAAKERYPMFDESGAPLWTPRVSLWCGGYGDEAKKLAEEIEAAGDQAFGKKYPHMRNDLYAAFKRLHPSPVRGGNRSIYPADKESLLDAIYLWMHRDNLPVAFHLVDDEKCHFLLHPWMPAAVEVKAD